MSGLDLQSDTRVGYATRKAAAYARAFVGAAKDMLSGPNKGGPHERRPDRPSRSRMASRARRGQPAAHGPATSGPLAFDPTTE